MRRPWRRTPPPDYVAIARQRFEGLTVARTLVVGDSHVQDGHFGESLGEHSRRGIGGMALADVARVLPVVASPQVERLILWAGTNDQLAGRTAAQIEADLTTLLVVAREVCPLAKVVVVGTPSPAALAANTTLALSGETFANVSAASAHTSDGVHLTGVGYAIVNDVLRQVAG